MPARFNSFHSFNFFLCFRILLVFIPIFSGCGHLQKTATQVLKKKLTAAGFHVQVRQIQFTQWNKVKLSEIKVIHPKISFYCPTLDLDLKIPLFQRPVVNLFSPLLVLKSPKERTDLQKVTPKKRRFLSGRSVYKLFRTVRIRDGEVLLNWKKNWAKGTIPFAEIHYLWGGRFQGRARCHQGVLKHQKVANTSLKFRPVEIEWKIKQFRRKSFKTELYRINSLFARQGDLVFEAQGEVCPDRTEFFIRFDGKMKPLGIHELITQLPPAAMQPFTNLSAEGKIGLDLFIHFDRHNLDGSELRVVPRLSQFSLVDLGLSPSIKNLADPDSFPYRKSPQGPWRLVNQNTNLFTSFPRLPLFCVGAILCAEDISFFKHTGIDLMALKEALFDDLIRGSLWRGGSTLTQQLARNLYLSQEKNLLRKLQEAVIACGLEQDLSKERIFELYVNFIEWGINIYGIFAASRIYFNKNPEQLNPLEAACLASMIHNPRRYHRELESGQLSEYWIKRMQTILEKMKIHGYITEEEFNNWKGQSINFQRNPID